MIDSLEKVTITNKNMNRIININKNLSNHLIGCTMQLLRYGEKYNVVIPKRDQLEQILKNTLFLLEEKQLAVDIFNKQNSFFNGDSDQPTFDSDKNNRGLYRTQKKTGHLDYTEP